jgi:hypothetical protein
VRAAVAILLLLPQVTGCYTYVPVTSSSVPAGTLVSAAVTDRGRVELAERIGPGVRRIGGSVVAATDTSIALSVNTIQYLDLGVPLKWSGERVQLSRGLLTDVRERKLAKTRTFVMVGLVTAGLIATSLIAIKGFGGDSPNNRPGGGGDDES